MKHSFILATFFRQLITDAFSCPFCLPPFSPLPPPPHLNWAPSTPWHLFYWNNWIQHFSRTSSENPQIGLNPLLENIKNACSNVWLNLERSGIYQVGQDERCSHTFGRTLMFFFYFEEHFFFKGRVIYCQVYNYKTFELCGIILL